MARQKIGRNDPCPCGSGKKYKHCCGPVAEVTDISVDPFIRYSGIMTALKLKLEQANHKDIRKHRRSLQSRFLRFAAEKLLPREHDTIFSDWLWFDVIGDNGHSMGEDYLMENGPYLDPASRNCLEALNRSRLGLYEAIGSSGMHLYLKDLATSAQKRVLLKEPLEFDNSGIILLMGRLAELPEDNIFSGMVLMLQEQSLERAFLTEHIQYLLSLLADEDAEEVLKQNSEIIFGIFNHAQHKTLLKLNDMRFLYHHSTQSEAAQRIIDANLGYEPLHQTKGWIWLGREGGSGPYARLVVGPELVLSCSDILDDVNNQIKHLTALWPHQPLQLLSSVLYPVPPAAEMGPVWFMAVMDKETERWLDTPHPEEGYTPRQMIKQEGGKQALDALLSRFEASRESKEEQELAAYMRERLQSGLNLQG